MKIEIKGEIPHEEQAQRDHAPQVDLAGSFGVADSRLAYQRDHAPQVDLAPQFLPTEDGEFNGNEQPEPDFSALEEIKYLACTAGAPDYMPVHKALARILFLCNRAGVTKKLDELRPLFETTENHS